MSYKVERIEKTIINNIHTCSKCGKKFNFIDDSIDDSTDFINSTLSEHTKQCDCEHSWTAWGTVNLGTWPDYEPYTTRECNKCGKKESI